MSDTPPPRTLRPLGRAPLVRVALGGLLAVAATAVAAWSARVDPAAGSRPDDVQQYDVQGVLLVANQQSGSASLVDLATGLVTHLPVGEEPHDAAISPDGRWGVVSDYARPSDGNRLVVIDMPSRMVSRTIDLGDLRGVHDLAFLPGSSTRVVVTAQRSRRVVEVDLERGAVVGTIPTRADGSHSLSVARDGRTLVTANEESSNLSVLDLGARRFVAHISVEGRVAGVALTRGGREVWVGTREPGVVRVVEVATGAVLARLEGFGVPDRIAMSADGSIGAVADWERGAVYLVDPEARRVRGVVSGLGRPHAVEIAPDNRTAFVTLGGDRAVAVLDLEARRVAARYPVQRWPDGVAWGPASPPLSDAPQDPADHPTVRLPGELQRVLSDYESAWRAGDEARLAELFHPSGYVLQPASPPVRGRDAIRRRYRDSTGPLHLRPIAYAAQDTIGYVVGAYGVGERLDVGKFLLALRRASLDHPWLIAADMDNLNSR